MRSPTHSEGATVSTMHIFEGPRDIEVVVYGDGTADLDVAETDLEPEELRLIAKACTQAAQHIEAARR